MEERVAGGRERRCSGFRGSRRGLSVRRIKERGGAFMWCEKLLPSPPLSSIRWKREFPDAIAL
jgi:hypothetical protein